VSSREELRHIHGHSVASIAAGYVGLSLIQSLSFGVVQIVADDEPHSPEIAAAHFGRNALSFRANDADDLARCLSEVWQDRDRWLEARNDIARSCADSYSVDVMVESMIAAVRMAQKR